MALPLWFFGHQFPIIAQQAGLPLKFIKEKGNLQWLRETRQNKKQQKIYIHFYTRPNPRQIMWHKFQKPQTGQKNRNIADLINQLTTRLNIIQFHI